MYWTGFMTGILVGANLGIVIPGMLFAAKRGDVEALASETKMDYAVMGEVEETPGECFLARHGAPGEQQFRRPALADDPRQHGAGGLAQARPASQCLLPIYYTLS